MGREIGSEEEGQPLKQVSKMGKKVEVFSKEGEEEEGFISKKKKGEGEGGVKLKAEMTLMNGCTVIFSKLKNVDFFEKGMHYLQQMNTQIQIKIKIHKNQFR